MNKSNSLIVKRSNRLFIAGLTAILMAVLLSCSTEAKWNTKNVEIGIDVELTSACFINCHFTTSKDAYYLVDIVPAVPGYDPYSHQKQFMNLAIDSAYIQYLAWRYDLLVDGEFNIAPFASHCLQYGAVNHVFTDLEPNTTYWIYAFVVNPETRTPAGKLNLVEVKTTDKSVVPVHFEYRVKGYWDYIYPLDSTGQIITFYPYVAASCDSADAWETFGQTPAERLIELLFMMTETPELMDQNALYGVKAINNGYGGSSHVFFEEGHTYYTAIAGCDGDIDAVALYRFVWTGEEFEAYFTHEDNILSDW